MGIFHCDIFVVSNNLQRIYIGIYTATTGESCTLKSNMFLEQEPISIIISWNTLELYIYGGPLKMAAASKV